VILAADLQDPPEVVVDLLAAADSGHDVVWATESRAKEPRHDGSVCEPLQQADAPDRHAQLAAEGLRLRDDLAARARGGAEPARAQHVAVWTDPVGGLSPGSVSYQRLARRAGRSKWTFGKKLKLAIDSFVSFSYVPIRLIRSWNRQRRGGAVYAGVVVTRRILLGAPVEGWASLMVAVMVLGGAQLLMLGVIGEYLWRTLDEARGRRPSSWPSRRVRAGPKRRRSGLAR
jgi:dolichol-phosphate mannosyltransferase